MPSFHPISLEPHAISGLLASAAPVTTEIVPAGEFARVAVGDILWVRDSFAAQWSSNAPYRVPITDVDVEQSNGTHVRASEAEPVYAFYRQDDVWSTTSHFFRWKPPRKMPAWASRLTLKVTGVEPDGERLKLSLEVVRSPVRALFPELCVRQPRGTGDGSQAAAAA